MPIKVRCRGCEKVLTIPDAARGKTVQCPECGEKMKIPAGEEPSSKRSAPAAAKPAAKKPAKKDDPAQLSGEIFANLNLNQVESEEGQICPYCAAPLDEEDPVCRGCGMNVETGKMDKKEQKKRARKGPDTAKYWKEAWTDPWEFVREHTSLSTRTGLYWTQFAFLVCACYFMAHDYCTKGPPKTFWYFMTALSLLGIPGWYWFLAIKLIQAEVFREKIKPDRIHFDFLQNVAIGLRAIIWPMVVFLPVWMIIGILMLVAKVLLVDILPNEVLSIIGIVSLAAPFLVFPLATIHMTSKYTYRAWIFWELLVTFAKNAAPSFYWLLQALVMMSPIALIVFALQQWGGGANPFSNTYVDQLVLGICNWFFKLIGEQISPEEPGFLFTLLRVVLEMICAFLIIAPIAVLAAFPAVYLMRSNALMAYYFQPTLELVNDIRPGTPAGFWVRFLAYWGDSLLIPLSSFLVLRDKRAVIVGQLINVAAFLIFMFQPENLVLKQLIATIFSFYNSWMYFVVQESGSVRSTVVKEAFGMVVNTNKGKQMTMGQATKRWFCMLLSSIPLGAGFLMCAFDPKKRALHDIMSQTEVVWRGDK